MKKEILRIHELNSEYGEIARLSDISLCLMARECVCFQGLENSGKNLLIDILCGKRGVQKGKIYVQGRRIGNIEDIQKNVYRISESNYLIDNWTVAEYMCLVDSRSCFGIISQKKLIAKAAMILAEFGLEIDTRKELSGLSELEKRLVDLVKAHIRNAKILIIEDEFEGCSTQDIEHFKKVMDMTYKEDMTVIINSNSFNVSYILSDKFVIFKKGLIVKKCGKDYIQSNSHLEEFLLGTSPVGSAKIRVVTDTQIEEAGTGELVYAVRKIVTEKNQELSFDFYKGEIATIIVLDVKEKEKIFKTLSGRAIDRYAEISLEHKECRFNDITDFVKSKIVSIENMGGKEELLLRMSVGENLLIPSMKKITASQYVLTEHKMVKMLEKEVRNNILEVEDTVKNMSTNDFIVLLLERWYIYKPKVLVLFEPFIHCDIYGVSLVKSYIRKFSESGTTVIVVKSREEYAVDLSNRIINIG